MQKWAGFLDGSGPFPHDHERGGRSAEVDEDLLADGGGCGLVAP
jgi:hypothetical protein